MRDFFEQEAREYLERLDRIAAADGVPPEPADLYAAARGLRGSAQMAREGRVQEVAATLEGAASSLQNGELAWSEDLRDRLRRTVDDLRHLVQAQGGPDELEERVAAGVQRWRDVGVEPAVRGVSSAMGAPRSEVGASPAAPEQPGFLSYAATELSAIIGELDAAQPELERHPRSAEAHAPVIRRAGALLGAAQLGRLGSAATILRALDDVSRTAPRLPADADREILHFLRQAREGLGSAAAALREGRTPSPDTAAEETDRLRQNLLEQRPSAEPPDAARVGDDFPVEVVNFFRSESGTILDRLERIARDLADASEERATALREDAGNALAALRDTAVTFGFNAAAAKARAALERAGGAAAEELRETTANLRAIVERPGGASRE
ncbi:MAG: Hpt domain-containing protein, partial [Longimicrobiales bacterium]